MFYVMYDIEQFFKEISCECEVLFSPFLFWPIDT
jgi:hypothetical protein